MMNYSKLGFMKLAKRFVHGMLYTEVGSRILVCPSAQQTHTCLVDPCRKWSNRTTIPLSLKKTSTKFLIA